MKTRVYNLGISLTLCLFLTACNQEEFYEKEFLETPYSGNTSGGTSDGGNTDGGTVAGTDGGTVAGTDGGTVAGTDGGTVAGTDGGTVAGTDGGTVAGTDGGTVAGTDGGTVAGTDGGTIAGTDGGSTDGGNTDGGTIGGVSTTPREETFNQAESETKKLDIVWIIDNSGSMADEQAALGDNFSAFIDSFITKNVDFKMAITTTDTSSSTKKGQMVSGSDIKLTSIRAQQNPNQFKSDFRSLVKVGTRGSGSERGLSASEGFMEKYSSSFLRADAYLAVVVISDEEDQSASTVKHYTDYLKSHKSTEGLVKVYTVADIHKTNRGSGIATGADRYMLASNQTAGAIADIREDFHMTLNDMGESIINLLDSFALAHDPVPGTLKVYVNGVLSNDYTFDSVTRSIKFNANHIPSVGAVIKVHYESL